MAARAPEGIEFWMGDSRGHWEGDTLIVNVTDQQRQDLVDMAGNFHSEAMQLVEALHDARSQHDRLPGYGDAIPRSSRGRGPCGWRSTGTWR